MVLAVGAFTLALDKKLPKERKLKQGVPGTIGGPDGTGTGLPVNGRAPVIPQTGLPRGTAGKKAAKVPGAGIPGLVPGQGFSGRGVLPGVATGTNLNPKSSTLFILFAFGAQQGSQGGPGFGGLMQPGVFHGYPLKSPKVQGESLQQTWGKLPFGYGGFGTGGSGLPGGLGGSGSRPGYPVGTGVGSGGISPGQDKPGKYGAGGGVGGIGGVGGVGATGGLGGGGFGGIGGVGGIGG
ncbi:elastin-like, partial [Nematolebias whitei]|uniref:elastin-like n=1 Tax=Nematolebias whitei TaxID=451745 RepID=UPI00189ADB8D